MLIRRVFVAMLLTGLAWPVAAEARDCSCTRKAPAAHACCPSPKPAPVKKSCCSVAPEERSKGEAVEAARPAAQSGPRLAYAAILNSSPAFDLRSSGKVGPTRGGDPPGDPPRLHLSNCTFRI